METVKYEVAEKSHIPGLAALRAVNKGSQPYWEDRIKGYMTGEVDPQKALKPRIVYVASENGRSVGLIAGHLTQRFDCSGELEWIDVLPTYQGTGISTQLFHLLASWFIGQGAFRICVNVDPANSKAHGFYKKHGAQVLNEHWLIWEDIRTTGQELMP